MFEPRFDGPNSSVLVLKALRIRKLSLPGSFAVDEREFNEVLRQWMEIASIDKLPRPSELGPRVDALWKTVCSSQIGETGHWRRDIGSDYSTFFNSCWNQSQSVVRSSHDLAASPFEFFTERRLFVTEHDTFGLAFPEATVGDEVYIIPGRLFLYILRRREDVFLLDGDVLAIFQYIGDCYCHGFMDGEALEGNWEERMETIAIV